jgi:hypothetical protein
MIRKLWFVVAALVLLGTCLPAEASGTSGTGSVVISGTEQSSSVEFCNDFPPFTCTTRTIYDS